MEPGPDQPAVLAVLVATDGAPTLARTLAGLAAQDYPALHVVAVDNGSSDSSRTLLRNALGRERVLVAERDLGFGGAVDLALGSAHAVDRPLVLLVHDDLELRPDAVTRLVAAFAADPQLAVAGCKLVEWDDARQLQAVGMRVDVTGRADSGVDADEIDQGQHDHVDEVLYVSTAGMMVDRATYDALGRLDVRFHLFRDDLDLCWRAHLAGHHVEVVTDAVAQHDASAATYSRLGQTAFLGPRYFAERNTLASLLKNYGPVRLLWVLPLFLLVGTAKVAGFVATRRLSDAWQTVRAWLWNVLHLRETWRLRGRAQALRVRPDAELTELFGRVGTRVRAYAEALGDVVSGGSDSIEPSMPDPADVEVPTLTARVRRTLRTSPIGVAAVLLGLLGVVIAIPLLDGGAVRGGELAAWPRGATTLLREYAQPWTIADQPGVAQPSPSLGLLGLVGLVGGGSAWAAPRLLLLAVVPFAWLATLRAGRLVTERRLPRVAGATLYALSPPVLAALRTGQVRAALLAVLLPLTVVAGARALGPRVPLDRAWRAASLLAVLLTALVAVEPLALLPVAVAAGGVVLAVTVRALSGGTTWGEAVPVLARLGAAVAGLAALLLLSPPVGVPEPTIGGVATGTPWWRVLVLAPELPGFRTVLPGAGLLAGALLGLVLVDDRRRPTVAVLWSGLLVAAGAAWLVLRQGADAVVWAGAPLLLVGLSGALLLCVAFSVAPRLLGEHSFGWRQLAVAATTTVVVLGVVASAWVSVREPWDGYARDEVALPAFLATEPAAVGPFRVLVLADDGERVAWQLTDADGPSVTTVALGLGDDARAVMDEIVRDVLRDADPDAAARLGTLGVRYVLVPETGRSDALDAVLRDQLDLTAQPAATGLVLRVDTWLPRWSVVGVGEEAPLEASGVVTGAVPLTGLEGVTLAEDVVVLRSDVVPGGWTLRVDGELAEPRMVGPLPAWDVPGGSSVEVVPAATTERALRVGGQLLLLLLALSLALRAPRFARRAVAR